MQISSSETKAVLTAQPGQSVTINDLDLDMPVIPLQMQAGGPPLLLSDDPEYVRVPQGGMMRETVRPGIFKLYTYHVNAVAGIKTRITNVIENLGKKPMTMRMLRRAFPKPSKEYNIVGCNGLMQYFTSTPETKGYIVPPGESIPVDSEMENTLISYDELVHGFYEIAVDQPARITALQTTADKSGPTANCEIKELLPIPTESNAGRGYYPFSEYSCETPKDFVLDGSLDLMQLVLADGITDKWLTGWSSDIDKPTILAGNYGVMYKIRIHRKNDGTSWALLTWNQRAHERWCGGLAMVVGVNGEFISVPSDQIKIGAPPHACVISVLPPSDEPIDLIYSPPGASCLPNPLVFLPIKMI